MVSLAGGILVQQCDLSTFNITEITDQVIVTDVQQTTRTSGGDTAVVQLLLADGSATFEIYAGQSRTFGTLEPKGYSVRVRTYFIDAIREDYYTKLRQQLEAIANTPGESPIVVADALLKIAVVDKTLQEIDQTGMVQCTGTVKSGAPTRITIDKLGSPGGDGAWLINCG
jgi:hypothetical protein